MASFSIRPSSMNPQIRNQKNSPKRTETLSKEHNLELHTLKNDSVKANTLNPQLFALGPTRTSKKPAMGPLQQAICYNIFTRFNLLMAISDNNNLISSYKGKEDLIQSVVGLYSYLKNQQDLIPADLKNKLFEGVKDNENHPYNKINKLEVYFTNKLTENNPTTIYSYLFHLMKQNSVDLAHFQYFKDVLRDYKFTISAEGFFFNHDGLNKPKPLYHQDVLSFFFQTPDLSEKEIKDKLITIIPSIDTEISTEIRPQQQEIKGSDEEGSTSSEDTDNTNTPIKNDEFAIKFKEKVIDALKKSTTTIDNVYGGNKHYNKSFYRDICQIEIETTCNQKSKDELKSMRDIFLKSFFLKLEFLYKRSFKPRSGSDLSTSSNGSTDS